MSAIIDHLPGCDLRQKRRQRCSTYVADTTTPGRERSASLYRGRVTPIHSGPWTLTATAWQLFGAAWSFVWFMIINVLYVLYDADLFNNEWAAVVSLVAFAYGYLLVVVPGLLFACLLLIPAAKADRLAAVGLAATIASVVIGMTFIEIYFPT